AGRRAELGRLATRAIAVGRDPSDPAELAAFHLEELGAFAPESLLPGTDGRPAGRNWIAPVPGTPLDGSVLGTITPQPDGTRRHTGTQAAPWAGPDRHPAYVVAAADAGTGRVGITLPGGRRLAVPYAEFAELVARDPQLTGRDLWKTDVVLAVPRAGAAALPRAGAPQPRSLPLWVASATARSVWAPGGAAGLGRQGSASPLTVGADPGAAWTRTHPRDLF
ncbi:hypothetical protein NGM37_46535, partial [Streptomyces sp. TRM76130]|nr:hypothetical protein [Streptomyces sp. TRM76130]